MSDVDANSVSDTKTACSWMLTCYPQDVADGARILKLLPTLPGIVAYAGQLEDCPKTKKLHVQAWVEFKKSTPWQKIDAVILCPGRHYEKRKGTRRQAYDYCLKEESRHEGLGVTWHQCVMENPPCEKGQGQRTDLEKCYEMVRAGADDAEIAFAYPAAYTKCHAAIAKVRAAMVKPRALKVGQEPFFVEIVGPTGVRKTSSVIDAYPDAAVMSDEKGWFDGYNGQKVCDA